MALCSICNKNTAVVFVNKIIDGKPNIEGLCLSCAKQRGINPLSSMMKQYGMSEEDIENMNNQVSEIMNSVGDMDEFGLDGMDDASNPMASFSMMLNNMVSEMNEKEFQSDKQNTTVQEEDNKIFGYIWNKSYTKS